MSNNFVMPEFSYERLKSLASVNVDTLEVHVPSSMAEACGLQLPPDWHIQQKSDLLWVEYTILVMSAFADVAQLNPKC